MDDTLRGITYSNGNETPRHWTEAELRHEQRRRADAKLARDALNESAEVTNDEAAAIAERVATSRWLGRR